MSLMERLIRLMGHHDRRHAAIDSTIDALQRDDRELDRRLRILKDQVDVYQRTDQSEGSDHPHA
jgi:hypothetical protein